MDEAKIVFQFEDSPGKSAASRLLRSTANTLLAAAEMLDEATPSPPEQDQTVPQQSDDYRFGNDESERTQVKVGDIVRLSSGGPPMVVDAVIATGSSHEEIAFCSWFNENNRREQESFSAACLVKHKPVSSLA